MQRTTAFFLVLLLLLGSTGLPVSRHFCRGELKAMAVFGQAEKCHREQAKPQCPFHPAPVADATDGPKGCCDDESELIRIDEQELPLAEVLPLATGLMPFTPNQLFADSARHLRPRPVNRHEHYHPPPLIPDPVREFQVFRI